MENGDERRGKGKERAHQPIIHLVITERLWNFSRLKTLLKGLVIRIFRNGSEKRGAKLRRIQVRKRRGDSDEGGREVRKGK